MSLQKLAVQFGFDVNAKSVDAAISSVNSVDREISRVTRGVDKFMGLLGAGGVGAAVFAFAKGAVEEFAKEEQALNQLANALKNLGITDRAVTDDLEAFAVAQAKVSMATHDQIIETERALVTRGLYGAQLKEAVQAAINLSTKTGDLGSATEVVGKAFQGVTARLANFGIVIDSNTPKAEAFKQVLKEINEHFGGAAAAQMEGYSGKMHVLNEEWAEMTERLGQNLMPVAMKILDWFKDLNVVLEFVNEKVEKFFKKDRAAELREEIENLQKAIKNSVGRGDVYMGPLSDAISLAEASARMKRAMTELNALKAADAKSAAPGAGTGAGGVEIYDEKMERARTEILDFGLTEREKMYTRFFGDLEIKRRKDVALTGKTADQLKDNNKKMLAEMESDYADASKTFSGGFRQAIQEMEYAGTNWKANWNTIISGSLGPAKSAFHDFFTETSGAFLDLEALAKRTFQGILNAFLDMLESMAAKAAIYGIFSLLSGGATSGGGLMKFLGFAGGGYTGDGNPHELAGVVHKGEYVLDADTTSKIRAGQPMALATGVSGRGAAPTITNNITLNGGASSTDIAEICEKITEATRSGLRQAGEMANAVVKVGNRKAGVTGL